MTASAGVGDDLTAVQRGRLGRDTACQLGFLAMQHGRVKLCPHLLQVIEGTSQ